MTTKPVRGRRRGGGRSPNGRGRPWRLTLHGMEIPTLSDGVIRLNAHTFADVEAMVTGEDEEHARRFGWFPARTTEETGRAAIERWQQQWRTGGPTLAFAAREPATGRLVGGCEIRLGEDGVAAMSYWVFPFHRRRGYATRAVRLASDYACKDLAANLIELHIGATNTASRGVARRAGFAEDPGPARHGPLAPDEVLYSRSS